MLLCNFAAAAPLSSQQHCLCLQDHTVFVCTVVITFAQSLFTPPTSSADGTGLLAAAINKKQGLEEEHKQK
jgi:hypothetical protein